VVALWEMLDGNADDNVQREARLEVLLNMLALFFFALTGDNPFRHAGAPGCMKQCKASIVVGYRSRTQPQRLDPMKRFFCPMMVGIRSSSKHRYRSVRHC
jgi:hypothetical protein